MNIDIGSKIKTLRLSKSMTQEQLAMLLGVSRQSVSKWEAEHGREPLYPHRQYALGQALSHTAGI